MSLKVPEDCNYKTTIIKVKIGNDIFKREFRHNYDCSYQNFMEVVQSIININPTDIVSLKYRDNENYWITLADDYDVNFALHHEPILFLEVKLASNDQSKQPSDRVVGDSYGFIDPKSLTSSLETSAVCHDELSQRLNDLRIAQSSSSYNHPPRATQTTTAGYGTSPPQSLYRTTTSSSAGSGSGANPAQMQYGVPPSALFVPVNLDTLTHSTEMAVASPHMMATVSRHRRITGDFGVNVPQTENIQPNPFSRGALLQRRSSFHLQPSNQSQQFGNPQQQLENEQQQRGYQQQQPGYQQLQLDYQQLQPGYQQLQPGYQQMHPDYQQMQPDYQQQQFRSHPSCSYY